MATAVRSPSAERPQSSWEWFGDFLVQELSPFPGRSWTVVRMTIAATLVMLLIMVFRIPNAALGAYYTLLFSRDSARATITGVTRAVAAVCASLLYITLTVRLFLGDPFLHFLWVAGTLFLIFFLISALTEYLAGTGFGFLAVTSISAWDFPANTNLLLESTLWTALAVLLGAGVTVAVELVARNIHPSDELSDRLLARLETVEDALRSLADGRRMEKGTSQKLEQYAMTGTAGLRQLLTRFPQGVQSTAEMSATVGLAGRLVDLTARFSSARESFPAEQRPALHEAADRLSRIRKALKAGDTTAVADLASETSEEPSPAPQGTFLAHIESTIQRISQVYCGLQPLTEYLPSEFDFEQRKHLFKDDAFTSTAHLRFALKGTLAALSCYFLYNAVAWRGLSSSVATCMITALSTVGSSRQKQILRVAGAIIGGVILGMGAQIFLLPYMDGIGEFMLLFAAVTGISAWVTTSSPRISYAGAQTGFAFYITQLRGFGPQTSLVLARDDVFGILFGLLAMWVTFDRLWAKDTAADLIETFAGNMRRIACFDRDINTGELRTTINRAREKRAVIHDNFDKIRNLSDSLIFEFGAGWRRKVQLRDRVRRFQPQLRTHFLMQVALSQYRLQTKDQCLEPEAEQNVRESGKVLSLLADFEDPKKQGAATRLRQELNEEPKPAGEEGAGERDGQAAGTESAGTEAARLAGSMRELAVSLAKEMSRWQAEAEN